MRRLLITALLTMVGCTSGSQSPCGESATPLLTLARQGFGEGQVWFSEAVLYLPYEGAPTLSAVERLTSDDPDALPLVVNGTDAADCPQKRSFDKQIKKQTAAVVSGRGFFDKDQIFVIDCLCSVKELTLAKEQYGRLWVQ